LISRKNKGASAGDGLVQRLACQENKGGIISESLDLDHLLFGGRGLELGTVSRLEVLRVLDLDCSIVDDHHGVPSLGYRVIVLLVLAQVEVQEVGRDLGFNRTLDA